MGTRITFASLAFSALMSLGACGGSTGPRPLSVSKTVTKTVAAATLTAQQASVTIPCVDETTSHVDFLSAPVNCHIEAKGEGLGSASLLKRLNWHQWGAREATATGVADCGGTGCNSIPPVPAKIVVYRITGNRYSRARVTQRGSTVVQRLDELPYEPPSTPTETTTARSPALESAGADQEQQRVECHSAEELWELKGEEKGRQAVLEAYAAEQRGSRCNLRGAAAAGSVKAQEETEPGG